jgi:hypothetical protein
MTKTYIAPQAFTDEPRPIIALKAVDSSQVKAIGYDEKTSTLAVTFTRGTGAIYHYPDVPKTTYDAFMASDSIGVFFGKNIKNLPFKKFVGETA